jgi:serine/threonine-protein kinase
LIGQTIAHYKVTQKLGAGGMGEVYRARDERLGRDVAVKVLPQAFAADAGRMARLAREAQMLAALNHPHIAAIYGLEEGGPTRALVMELVEGQTLAERMTSGPLPLEDALPIARQITDALEYAHERGIIHRDLKPANIKVTPEGNVKILDFGLAKALEGEHPEQDVSASPTLTVAATQGGVILGTAAYMSPEQAKGKAADRRADVWAFGVVLYEMLAGQPLFAGETVSETLAGVIKEEPDWSRLPANLPAAIRKLVMRCLTKDPRQRLQAIGEARIAIEQHLAHPAAEAAGSATAPAVPVRGALLPWAATAVLALVAAIALWEWPRGRPPEPREVKRFAVQLVQNQVMFSVSNSFAVSPDGRHLVYKASRTAASGWQLFLRPMDQLEAQPLGDEDGEGAFFAPDGQWVGYFAGGKLKKISVRGGVPVTLCDGSLPRGATWGSDNTIVFTPYANTGLWRVSAAGGAPQPLTQLGANQRGNSHRWPHFLPSGEAVLFTIVEANNVETARIAVLNLRTGKWNVIVDSGTTPQYLPSGHIVFARGSTLFAVPFDAERLEVTGDAAPVVEGVLWDNAVGFYFFAVAADGTLVYVPDSSVQPAVNQIVWVDRKGVEKAIPAPARAYTWPRISPNGQQIAFRLAEGNIDIWVYQFSSGALPRLTFQPGEDETSVWTPDGKRVAYSSSIVGKPRTIFIKNADGSGAEEVLFEGGIHTHVSSISPDGRLLAFTDYDAATKGDIYVLPLQGERKPQPFLRTEFSEYDGKFSPDGNWIVYTSDESGQNEIYVQSFPGPGGKWQVSAGGGHSPVWARNGKEIFYRNGAKTMAVSVNTRPAFSPSAPRLLFEGTYLDNPRREANYDVSPDGQRFVMLKGNVSGSGPMQYVVVLNWAEEVKRRVPATRR